MNQGTAVSGRLCMDLKVKVQQGQRLEELSTRCLYFHTLLDLCIIAAGHTREWVSSCQHVS